MAGDTEWRGGLWTWGDTVTQVPYGAAAGLGDDAGQQLRLGPGRLHVLAVLLPDLWVRTGINPPPRTGIRHPSTLRPPSFSPPHLVAHVQHLLWVRVEWHELVGVLDADGGPTATLLHLVCSQPLETQERRFGKQETPMIDGEP